MSPVHRAPPARGAPIRRAVLTIVIAELLGTSLWFSTNAVADALQREWGVSLVDVGHLTSAVQLGFICGTLLIALSGMADRFSASRIFAACAIIGALTNAAFALSAGALPLALTLRFFTGMALAGIYPIGMKLMVSWAPEQVGRALGWLVGMLVLGSGLPHLIRGVALTPDWQAVVYTASALALVAGAAIWRLGDGPHHGTAPRLRWRAALSAFAVPQFRSAALGYFGHMWELYAFWALVPVLVAQAVGGVLDRGDFLIAFLIFAAGGLGCFLGGVVSQRFGSGRVAIVALAGSAAACAVYPLVQQLDAALLVALLVWWGLFVVADSPQFSALAATACEPERVGSGLALMNSIGFALTIPAIELVTGAWEGIDARVAWLLLPGPVFGLLAMGRFWRQPLAHASEPRPNA